MKRESPESSPTRGTHAFFQTTHWTLVLAARDKDDAIARDALATLCSNYWYPLYAFLRRRGADPHEAEDLTQEFFRRFLERNSIERVRPAAGRFRSFLLVCLKNFLANEREHSQAQRRGGGRRLIPLDAADAQARYAQESADQRTPEALFERRWAYAVLERTLTELRREYAAAEKSHLFESMQGFLPGGDGRMSRAELAARRGMSPGALDVAIHRLRQRFGALLREQVARTVSTEAEVDEEIRYLISLLSQ